MPSARVNDTGRQPVSRARSRSEETSGRPDQQPDRQPDGNRCQHRDDQAAGRAGGFRHHLVQVRDIRIMVLLAHDAILSDWEASGFDGCHASLRVRTVSALTTWSHYGAATGSDARRRTPGGVFTAAGAARAMTSRAVSDQEGTPVSGSARTAASRSAASSRRAYSALINMIFSSSHDESRLMAPSK